MNWTRRDSEPFDPSDIDEFTKWLDTASVDDFRYRVERRGPGGGIRLIIQDLPPEPVNDPDPPREPPPTIVIQDDGLGMASPLFRASDDLDD